MTLSEEQRAFVEANPTAAMITVGSDGLAKPARVAVLLVDGKLWSSGTATRVRTARLRRDPRCTMFVFEPGFRWLGLEGEVAILDGADAPDLQVHLFRLVQGKPDGPLSWFGRELDEPAFRDLMREEQRVIYELDVHRAYGLI